MTMGIVPENYLVVLKDRGDYILPWTAYPVEQPSKKCNPPKTRKVARQGAWLRQGYLTILLFMLR